MIRKNNDENVFDDSELNEEELPEDVQFEDIDEDARSTENVKKVRDKLKNCEKEKAEYLDGWQRAKADAINMRKRLEEDKFSAIRSAKEDALSSVIPALDSFDMAFSDEKVLEAIDPNWVNGMKGIQSQLIGTLAEHGVSVVDPTGEIFDPNVHDSVEVTEVDDPKEEGTILRVVQKGYDIDGKVLRAAKVVVGTYK